MDIKDLFRMIEKWKDEKFICLIEKKIKWDDRNWNKYTVIFLLNKTKSNTHLTVWEKKHSAMIKEKRKQINKSKKG